MITDIKSLITRHEGRKEKFYYDSLGFVTVGIGHLSDPRRDGHLPPHIVDLLFEWDVDQVRHDLPNWITAEHLGDVRYAVLVDMAFNLGVEGLLGFKNTLQLIKEGKYEEASVAMGESKWAKQVGSRAARLREMMRTGEWPTG